MPEKSGDHSSELSLKKKINLGPLKLCTRKQEKAERDIGP